MPSRRRASRFAPRAMNVTSSPAAASHPPTYPPIAPAPTTAIFTSGSGLAPPERLQDEDRQQRGEEVHHRRDKKDPMPSRPRCPDHAADGHDERRDALRDIEQAGISRRECAPVCIATNRGEQAVDLTIRKEH